MKNNKNRFLKFFISLLIICFIFTLVTINNSSYSDKVGFLGNIWSGLIGFLPSAFLVFNQLRQTKENDFNNTMIIEKQKSLNTTIMYINKLSNLIQDIRIESSFIKSKLDSDKLDEYKLKKIHEYLSNNVISIKDFFHQYQYLKNNAKVNNLNDDCEYNRIINSISNKSRSICNNITESINELNKNKSLQDKRCSIESYNDKCNDYVNDIIDKLDNQLISKTIEIRNKNIK